ncbi:hypothetical protein N799_01090 [Lysobacter arseniciresistens ZS79]|uniref:Uncharacterized protein n=1 Tax=Lysobacter arseniciresistens ZS79 TaxID=913325 RepID=A0A0A0F5M2_9GAMM|nr:hypothetical protein [Lysobacter arseniciresistens]KGM57790.1 hypothetical protein N799_01090 [Lysobacter arseniciresistens ZS79]
MSLEYADRFSLHPGTWRSWQMFPGYFGERMTPYFSPIHIRRVEPLKSGKSLLRLSFFNACYEEGVQDFALELKVLKRATNYLLADLPYDRERSAVIGHIEFSWLERFCPELLRAHPPVSHSSVSLYLDSVFAAR